VFDLVLDNCTYLHFTYIDTLQAWRVLYPKEEQNVH